VEKFQKIKEEGNIDLREEQAKMFNRLGIQKQT
jgi:hypothetical protein